MARDFVVDNMACELSVALSALGFLADQIADVHDDQTMPKGLRAAVQVVVAAATMHGTALIDWAEARAVSGEAA
ncbi:hypothetical protein GEU84_000555 [Fertoebacter nigrum]|uniref:Uncharacterized protein n=1 Tax=Fertoeibacter niger TaxID=2656921 RepID=A0A8X8KML8_9RHOB|nr:hypothetical protein [Fertoeibacter niger]NUB42861.1 hypothetical protein [Fertoeibacter niger]